MGTHTTERGSSPAEARLRARAEAGEAHAQYELGCLLHERDPAAAYGWYAKAAAQRHNSGLCDAAWCLRRGHGVAQDHGAAVPLYRLAAEQGCPTGAYWLAWACEKGEGVAVDPAQARHWYHVSAGRGDADAREALARLGW